MNDRANPVLIMLAAILMAAVTFVYVIDRSIDSNHYHLSMSSAATSPMPF
jgi:hypothetical protein